MSDDDASQIPPLRHRRPFSTRVPLSELETHVVSWDWPDSDPVGDMRRVADAYFNEYLTDGWRVFTPIPMRRPVWPRIVLFPRWDAMVERQRWRLQRMRWWWEERHGLG